jgi:hypothetical protein
MREIAPAARPPQPERHRDTLIPRCASRLEGESLDERQSRRGTHCIAFECWEFRGVRELRPRKRLAGVALLLYKFGSRRDHAALALETLRKHRAPWISASFISGAIRAAYGPTRQEIQDYLQLLAERERAAQAREAA